MDAVAAFRFHCHRCGNCCSGGAGYVWLADGEVERMAARLGMTPESFRARHVRTVTDPRSGAARESLRERDEGASGRCALLEGANHCSVYEDRPEHCKGFPFWESIRTDEEAFEAARATCPGIAVVVAPEVREEAFARLEALYAEVDAFVERARPVCIVRGVCCRFEEAGHELFATALEADYALARHPGPPPEAEAPGRCPYHVGGRCTARAGRPLGCRTYFCDRRTESVLADAHEHFLRKLRVLEAEEGYPSAYGRFPDLLAARAARALDSAGSRGGESREAGTRGCVSDSDSTPASPSGPGVAS
ncbi:MAG: YkgJ family cysteine cluster protein [bacterium]|nr:YkgJ family cysteine cluster protein [bacterium]